MCLGNLVGNIIYLVSKGQMLGFYSKQNNYVTESN